MSKNILSILIIALPLLFGGSLVYNAAQPVETPPETSDVTAQEQATEITFSDDQRTVSYTGQTGSTALEVLRLGADVSVQESDFGEFVTGINGVMADPSNEFWAFYVDGELSDVGAGTFQTTDGQQLLWTLENF